ncbi:unnamed protein product [Choristocarpus tenellus]
MATRCLPHVAIIVYVPITIGIKEADSIIFLFDFQEQGVPAADVDDTNAKSEALELPTESKPAKEDGEGTTTAEVVAENTKAEEATVAKDPLDATRIARRVERFGAIAPATKEAKMAKRKERFGIVSGVDEDKMARRLAKFGPVGKNGTVKGVPDQLEVDKRKMRMERFGTEDKDAKKEKEVCILSVQGNLFVYLLIYHVSISVLCKDKRAICRAGSMWCLE